MSQLFAASKMATIVGSSSAGFADAAAGAVPCPCAGCAAIRATDPARATLARWRRRRLVAGAAFGVRIGSFPRYESFGAPALLARSGAAPDSKLALPLLFVNRNFD